MARSRVDAEHHTRPPSLRFLTRSIDAGFTSYRQLTEREHWQALARIPEFIQLVDRTRDLVERARIVYERAGGTAILGPAGV